MKRLNLTIDEKEILEIIENDDFLSIEKIKEELNI